MSHSPYFVRRHLIIWFAVDHSATRVEAHYSRWGALLLLFGIVYREKGCNADVRMMQWCGRLRISRGERHTCHSRYTYIYVASNNHQKHKQRMSWIKVGVRQDGWSIDSCPPTHTIPNSTASVDGDIFQIETRGLIFYGRFDLIQSIWFTLKAC